MRWLSCISGPLALGYQRFVDCESSARALGRCNDGKLHIARDVTGHVHARHAGFTILRTDHPALLIKVTAEAREKRRAGPLT